MLASNIVNAGSFDNFEIITKHGGYRNTGKVFNGFLLYHSNKIDLFVSKNNERDVTEGVIIAKPASDDEMILAIASIYGPISKTLKVENIELERNSKLILSKIYSGLQNSNKYEYNYNNHIRIRGECYPVSKKDYNRGKRPALLIKLWIYQ